MYWTDIYNSVENNPHSCRSTKLQKDATTSMHKLLESMGITATPDELDFAARLFDVRFSDTGKIIGLTIPEEIKELSKPQKLAEFTCIVNGQSQNFEIFGNFEIHPLGDFEDDEEDPELTVSFNDISAICNGKPYTPNTYTWAGDQYTSEDIMYDFLASLSRDDGMYEMVFLDEAINRVVETCNQPVINVAGKDVSKCVLGAMAERCDLMLATNKYLFYFGDGDEVYMLRTEDHTIVSNNNFADDGYWQSIKAIHEGNEELLWGEIPDEE